MSREALIEWLRSLADEMEGDASRNWSMASSWSNACVHYSRRISERLAEEEAEKPEELDS